MARGLKINSRFKFNGFVHEPSGNPKKAKVISAAKHELSDADVDNLVKGGYVEVVEIAEEEDGEAAD